MNNLFCIFLLLWFSITNAFCQELISNGSSSIQSSEVTIDWTIGEMSIETLSNDNITLTQGFNQLGFIITNIKEELTSVAVTIFPNPTSDKLNIKIEDFNENATIRIFSASGKLLIVEELNSPSKIIDFNNFQSGTYILDLTINNKKNQYKIIKK